MAKGEDNDKSYVDESSSSTSSEYVPSHVHVNRVIMWLRPIGEARANTF